MHGTGCSMVHSAAPGPVHPLASLKAHVPDLQAFPANAGHTPSGLEQTTSASPTEYWAASFSTVELLRQHRASP